MIRLQSKPRAFVTRAGRSLGAVALMSLATFTTMCGERDGAKLKIYPSKTGDAGTQGDDPDSLGAAGAPQAGSGGTGGAGGSSGSGGTSTGMATGGSGNPSAGEGGSPPDGSGATGGSSANGGTGAADATGGTGATDATGGTNDGSGGTAGTTASGGSTTGGRASSGGSSGASIGGRGGAGAAAGASGFAGSEGTACGTKTSCCGPGDPPCLDGCPSGADFCCDANIGARLPCDPVVEFADILCLNSCTNTSFGTGSCDDCLGGDDPLCSNPAWDDACLTGGDARCSDPVAGYRASCDGTTGGTYYAYVLCTCSPGPDCVPTPCCAADATACELDGCALSEGYCCSATGNYSEVCTNLGGGLVGAQQFICLNDCTGRSYGTGSCTGCVGVDDPPCDLTYDWITPCNSSSRVYCSDPVAGYRLSCLEVVGSDAGAYPDIDVECQCNSGL